MAACLATPSTVEIEIPAAVEEFTKIVLKNRFDDFQGRWISPSKLVSID
jgi:hypothetical protein